MIGNEGLAGVTLVMGGATTTSRVMVQSKGQIYRLRREICRWLLLSLDRLGSDELTMTHEVLANTLGVRREGITEAARKLHNTGLINYRRGRITVIDRAGVEDYCCECYSVVRGEYDRLPGAYSHSLHRAPLAAVDRAARANGVRLIDRSPAAI